MCLPSSHALCISCLHCFCLLLVLFSLGLSAFLLFLSLLCFSCYTFFTFALIAFIESTILNSLPAVRSYAYTHVCLHCATRCCLCKAYPVSPCAPPAVRSSPHAHVLYCFHVQVPQAQLLCCLLLIHENAFATQPHCVCTTACVGTCVRTCPLVSIFVFNFYNALLFCMPLKDFSLFLAMLFSTLGSLQNF